ncbi:hypothetical protein BOX15_Mlig009021g3, partial [Macrostomum lignano]
SSTTRVSGGGGGGVGSGVSNEDDDEDDATLSPASSSTGAALPIDGIDLGDVVDDDDAATKVGGRVGGGVGREFELLQAMETDRTSVSSSDDWGDCEYDMLAAQRVNSLFEQIDCLLYRVDTPVVPPKKTQEECSEWAAAFPHLLVRGNRLTTEEFEGEWGDAGVRFFQPPREATPRASAAAAPAASAASTDAATAVPPSLGIDSLCLVGQSAKILQPPTDASSSQIDDNNDDGAEDDPHIALEEILAADGLVEEAIALDDRHLQPAVDRSSDAIPDAAVVATAADEAASAERPSRRSGLPPMTPSLAVRDSLQGAAFDALWLRVAVALRPLCCERLRRSRRRRQLEEHDDDDDDEDVVLVDDDDEDEDVELDVGGSTRAPVVAAAAKSAVISAPGQRPPRQAPSSAASSRASSSTGGGGGRRRRQHLGPLSTAGLSELPLTSAIAATGIGGGVGGEELSHFLNIKSKTLQLRTGRRPNSPPLRDIPESPVPQLSPPALTAALLPPSAEHAHPPLTATTQSSRRMSSAASSRPRSRLSTIPGDSPSPAPGATSTSAMISAAARRSRTSSVEDALGLHVVPLRSAQIPNSAQQIPQPALTRSGTLPPLFDHRRRSAQRPGSGGVRQGAHSSLDLLPSTTFRASSGASATSSSMGLRKSATGALTTTQKHAAAAVHSGGLDVHGRALTTAGHELIEAEPSVGLRRGASPLYFGSTTANSYQQIRRSKQVNTIRR